MKLGAGVLASVAGEVALARHRREHPSEAEVKDVRPTTANVSKETLELYALKKEQVHAFVVETTKGRSTVVLTDEGYPIPVGA